MENKPAKEKGIEELTTPEEVIFEELQKVARKNFSSGGEFYEDSQKIAEFIAESRSQITEYIARKKKDSVSGMNEVELQEYQIRERDIILKFEYLFLNPDTELTYREITEASF